MPRDQASAEQLAWERTCSPAITSDGLWKLDAYRSALFLIDCVREDVSGVPCVAPNDRVLSQLLEAGGSVSANIGEGYSRATRADRLRFLGYSLSSTRECITWYHALRGPVASSVIAVREELIARTRALVLGLIRSIRDKGTDSTFEP